MRNVSKKIKPLLTSSFLKQGVLFTGISFFGSFLNYLFNSLSAKRLGPTGYGEIATLFAYATVFSGIPTLAISNDIIRRLGQKGDHKLVFIYRWEQWMFEKSRRWIYLIIPYFLLIFLLPPLTNLSVFSTLTLLFIVLFTFISAFYVAAYQGIRWFALLSYISLAATFIKLAGPVLVYFHVDGINTILTCLIFSAIIPLILCHYFLKKSFKKLSNNERAPKVDKRLFKAILYNKPLVTTAFSITALNILNNLDVIFVKKYFSPQEAGMYAAWSLFAKIIFFVFGSTIGLSFVFFTSREYAKYQMKALMGILLVFFIGAIVSFYFYSSFGFFLINVIFTPHYQVINQYLPLASLFGFFYSLIFILNNYFLAKNSRFSLLAFFGAIFYAMVLFSFGQKLESIFLIDVYSSSAIAGIYLLAIFYYNMRKWNSKNQATS